jgi:hypothetical protein
MDLLNVIEDANLDVEEAEDIYLVAVEQNGYILKDVPEDLKTRKICFAAVRQDG